MHDNESMATFFLRVDEIINSMRNIGDKIKYATVVENILRSLTLKFDSKVLATEEMQDLKSITLDQLHGILTAFEMRKRGPSDMREETLKATYKGKYKEASKDTSYISDEEEEKFVRKLQVGTGRFRGKIPFKCFACGRVGHYASKFPYK